MKKENVKEFFKKHKTAFTIAAGVTTAAVAGVVGYKIGFNRYVNTVWDGFFVPNEGVTQPAYKVLSSISEHTMVNLFGCYGNETPLAADQLGELGKIMTEDGVTDETFTHFIAIGKK